MKNQVQQLASAIDATIRVIERGEDKSYWFGVRRAEWENYIKAHREQYSPSIIPQEVYARKVFNEYFMRVLRRKDPNIIAKSLPDAYGKVFKWICNNDRKGLFMIGDCGTGKTAITIAIKEMLEDGHGMWYDYDTDSFKVEPRVFKAYTASQLLDVQRLDEALSFRLVIIDDIGTESETSVNYGQRRNPIAEVIDNTERYGGLLIMTSNLSGKELLKKYGARTVDRINDLCKIVQFSGDSFRGL